MTFLPVIERELRVAAHQPKTWRRRLVTGLAGAAVLFLIYLNAYRGSTTRMGRELFEGLTVFGFVFCLLSGPLATSDTLSAERRGGTLGLLFLTPLRSWDVVLGKMVASGLMMGLSLLGFLPFLALPLLMGGVTWGHFLTVSLALMVILFLSLAVGLVVSSWCASWRAALLGTAMVLLGLTLGLPLVGEVFLRIRQHSQTGPFFYACCPLSTLDGLFRAASAVPRWPFWFSLACQFGLGWGLIGIACWRTARAWKDRPLSFVRQGWRALWQRWSLGRSAARQSYRTWALGRNPVFWLDDRYRLQKTALWALLLLFLAWWFFQFQRLSWRWLDEGILVLSGLLPYYGLCLWLAFQAAHRLPEDRQSGALELLLCTPLRDRDIVRGRWLAVRRQFGWAFVVLWLFDWGMLAGYEFGYKSIHITSHEFRLAALEGLGLFPVQCYTIAWVALWQSVVCRHALPAVVNTVGRVVALPWLMLLGVILAYEFHWIRRFRLTDDTLIVLWFLFQAVCTLFFLARARWELRHRFRTLAVRPAKASWWWKWLGV